MQNPATTQKEPWPRWLHFILLLAAQAAYALAYVNSPYLRTAILVPQLFRLAVWTVPVFLFLALEKRPVLDYLKLRHDVLRGATCGVVFGVLILAGNVVVHFAMSGSWQLDFRIGAQRWVGPVALVGLSEEVVFRGFFLQKSSEHIGFARANLLQALLFMLMHLPGLILMGQFRSLLGFRLTGFVLLFALFSGWLLRRSRSLWACMIAHSFSNLASFVVPGRVA